jgi:hypothetical protein
VIAQIWSYLGNQQKQEALEQEAILSNVKRALFHERKCAEKCWQTML